MKCPMQTVEWVVDESLRERGFFECIKKECGQWDKDQKCCSEVSKARAGWALVKVWQEIREKMPFPKEK